MAGLAGLAVSRARASRLVGENRQHIGQVPQAGEEEEEHGDAFDRLAPPVEQELRQAGSEIQQRAQPAENLAPEIELRTSVRGFGFMAARSVAAQVPSRHAGDADHEDGRRVGEEDAQLGGRRRRRGRGAGDHRDGRGEMLPAVPALGAAPALPVSQGGVK